MSDRVAPIERLRELYARWDQGDFSTTRELLAPDVEWHQAANSIEPGVRHGHEGAETITRNVFEAFADVRVTADEFLDRGDTVVVVSRIQASARLSGMPVNRVMAQVWTFAGDRAARLAWFASKEEALAALEP